MANTVKKLEMPDGTIYELADASVDGKLLNYLPLAGGTMRGDINLGTNHGLMGTTSSGGVFDILRLQDSTKLQIGGTYPELLLKGKNAKPTYNGSEMALMSDVNKKADDYSIEMYNGTSGNPKPVKFISVDYSSCGSENGVAIKLGMVSGHGNGSSYAFLQDTIIKVTYTGDITVDNFKYYGASTGTYDGADRQYGDIFWVHNANTKVVDFYVLMGQYSRVQMTPWKRVTYSTGGSITQYNSATVYSSGTKEWGNNSEIAMMSDLAAIEEKIEELDGSVISVVAGNGLTGSSSGNEVTLNVGAGNGITVAADAISAKAGSSITVDANGIHNAGVRSVATGDTNGTIKVNTGGTSTNVAVKGLGTLAYQNLDNNKIPSSLLPSYVDDVLEYANKASFPTTGESGKIYIAKDTNITYR